MTTPRTTEIPRIAPACRECGDLGSVLVGGREVECSSCGGDLAETIVADLSVGVPVAAESIRVTARSRSLRSSPDQIRAIAEPELSSPPIRRGGAQISPLASLAWYGLRFVEAERAYRAAASAAASGSDAAAVQIDALAAEASRAEVRLMSCAVAVPDPDAEVEARVAERALARRPAPPVAPRDTPVLAVDPEPSVAGADRSASASTDLPLVDLAPRTRTRSWLGRLLSRSPR